MRYLCVLLSSLLAVQACSSLSGQRSTTTSEPPSGVVQSERPCQIQQYQAETQFSTNVDSKTSWSVTFDEATSRLLSSRAIKDGSGLHRSLNELDCLLNRELKERCPRWIHDAQVAIELPDGRLRAQGACAPAREYPT